MGTYIYIIETVKWYCCKIFRRNLYWR